jgi:hypothetical protein
MENFDITRRNSDNSITLKTYQGCNDCRKGRRCSHVREDGHGALSIYSQLLSFLETHIKGNVTDDLISEWREIILFRDKNVVVIHAFCSETGIRVASSKDELFAIVESWFTSKGFVVNQIDVSRQVKTVRTSEPCVPIYSGNAEEFCTFC